MVARNDGDELREARARTRCPTTSVAPSPVAGRDADRGRSVISTTVLAARPARLAVIRGSAQLIPIGNAIFYVRPIYVEGQGEAAVPASPLRRGHVRRAGGARCDFERHRHRHHDGARRARGPRHGSGPDEPRATDESANSRRSRAADHDHDDRAATDRRASSQLLAAGGRRARRGRQPARDGRRPRARTRQHVTEAKRLAGPRRRPRRRTTATTTTTARRHDHDRARAWPFGPAGIVRAVRGLLLST